MNDKHIKLLTDSLRVDILIYYCNLMLMDAAFQEHKHFSAIREQGGEMFFQTPSLPSMTSPHVFYTWYLLYVIIVSIGYYNSSVCVIVLYLYAMSQHNIVLYFY